MPGTTRPEFYEMSFEDAVAIALADEATLLMQVDAEAAAELKRAAQWVVERHAEEIAARYLTPDGRQPNLRLIQQGDDHDRRRRRTADDERRR